MPQRRYFLRYTREWGTPSQLLNQVLTPFAGFLILVGIITLCITLLGVSPAFLFLPITIVAAVAGFVFMSHSSRSFLLKSLEEIEELRSDRKKHAEQIQELIQDLDGRSQLTLSERRQLFETLHDFHATDHQIQEEVSLYNRRVRRASKKLIASGDIPAKLTEEDEAEEAS